MHGAGEGWGARAGRGARPAAKRGVCVLLAVIAGVMGAPSEARADDHARTCAPMDGGSMALGLVDPGARVQFIQDTLYDQAKRARNWTWAMEIGGVGLIAGGIALAAITTRDVDRFDDLVGAATSVFIPATVLAKPLRVMRDADALHALTRVLTGPDGRVLSCALVSRAEELLVLDAEDEAFGTGALAQTVSIGGSVAIAGALGFGLGHWRGAALQLGGGILVSEIKILTQPTGAIRALARYRAGRVSMITAKEGPRWTLAPLGVVAPLGPTYGGALTLVF